MYSAHNKGKYLVAERFVKTLKNKIYKHMASISKSMNIKKFNDKVNIQPYISLHNQNKAC